MIPESRFNLPVPVKLMSAPIVVEVGTASRQCSRHSFNRKTVCSIGGRPLVGWAFNRETSLLKACRCCMALQINLAVRVVLRGEGPVPVSI